MKTITLLLGACALAALSAGTAGAGPCTTEIDNVTKLLASKDAGAGPTAGASATTGQHPPSATMGAADPSASASSAAAELGAAATSAHGGHESGHAGRRPNFASGQQRARAASADRRHGPGRARRRHFAAGRAEPEPRRAHGGAAGGRRPSARVRQSGVGAGRAQRGPRLRSGRPGSRLHGCDSTGEAARRLILRNRGRPHAEERAQRASRSMRPVCGRPSFETGAARLPQDEAVQTRGLAARKANRWPSSQTHDVKQRSVVRSRGALLRPGSRFSFRVHPRMRGGRSADRRTISFVAFARRDDPRE